MSENIEFKAQFPDTPQGWAERWSVEFAGARKELQEFHERSGKVDDRYLGEDALNLFYGDVETKKALLYGNPPQVRSRRRFADPDDDEARVSADMLGRLLNTDIQRDTDGFRDALALARDDRLLPGLGVIRERYVVEMEDVPEQPAQTDEMGNELAPAVPATKRKRFEDVETDYVHWRDFLWGAARVWDEVPWVAFRAEMTREKLHERFDDTIAEGDVELGARLVATIPLNAKERKEERFEDPWARAAVWEIWCKESRKVYWYVEGFDRILDVKDDPLGLDSFWPCPRPLFANTTSKKLVPKSDYVIHQKMYERIVTLAERLAELEKAIRVTGVFDKSNSSLAKIVEGGRNTLYPVDNWGAHVEKGGLAAAVDLLPLEGPIKAIDVLTAKLREAIALKDQAVGIADVMRGQGTPGGGVTATERRIQARSASTRQRAAQDEFARFTTEAQQIRAQIIAKHFDPETIIERSNVLRTKDAQMAQKAAELIKSEYGQFRIEVATDTLGQTDYDAVQQERMGAVTALGGFLNQSAPLVQMGGPPAMEFVLEAASWLMAGLQGGASLESVFDKFKSMAQQAAQAPKPPPPPDPKVEAAKVGLETKKFEAGAKVQATKMDMQVKTVEHGMAMEKLKAEQQRDIVKAAMPQREFPT